MHPSSWTGYLTPRWCAPILFQIGRLALRVLGIVVEVQQSTLHDKWFILNNAGKGPYTHHVIRFLRSLWYCEDCAMHQSLSRMKKKSRLISPVIWTMIEIVVALWSVHHLIVSNERWENWISLTPVQWPWLKGGWLLLGTFFAIGSELSGNWMENEWGPCVWSGAWRWCDGWAE
jgi:hypothetical protein